MSENKIGGKKREQVDFGKKIGLFSAKVIAINPTREEYKTILGMELKEESKADEYLGESKENNTTLRVNVWLEEAKTKQKLPVVFFLENKVRENKDATKKQYINDIGMCSWADDPNNLKDWFTKRDYREAYVGEEDMYSFLRTWLGLLDYRDAATTLQIEWKRLMKGDVRDLKAQIGGEYCTNVGSLAIVKTITKEGEDEPKEYQGVYNRGFLPEYALKQFRLIDYNKPEEQARLRAKTDLKPHERFVLQVSDVEHGCKDSYTFKDFQDYDPKQFLVASDSPMGTDDLPY